MGNCRLLTVPESLFGGYSVLGSLTGMTLEIRFCEDGRVLLDQLNAGEADICLIPAKSNSALVTYGWDELNRLTGWQTREYTYRADGMRTRKKLNNTST